jgi:hypothetical protein
MAPGNVSPGEIGVVNALINIIRQFALAVSLVIWAIVGFLFWIPMLVYSIVQFSAMIVYATITDADPNSLATRLERAVRFYLEGFRNVIKAIYRRKTDGPATTDVRVEITKIIVHVIGTVLFWLAVTALILWGTGALSQWFSELRH